MPQPKLRTGKRSKQGAPATKKRIWVGVRVARTFHRRILTECARRDLRFHLEDSGLTRKEASELRAWSDLWDTYIQKVPREKIEVMEAAMQWDLRTLKSSRRKPSTGKPAPPEEKG